MADAESIVELNRRETNTGETKELRPRRLGRMRFHFIVSLLAISVDAKLFASLCGL